MFDFLNVLNNLFFQIYWKKLLLEAFVRPMIYRRGVSWTSVLNLKPLNFDEESLSIARDSENADVVEQLVCAEATGRNTANYSGCSFGNTPWNIKLKDRL